HRSSGMVLGYDTPSLISTSCRSTTVTRPRTRARLLPRNSIVYCAAGLPEARNFRTELSSRSRSRAARSLRRRLSRGDSCIARRSAVACPRSCGLVAVVRSHSRPAGDDLGIDDQVVAVLHPGLDQGLTLDQPPATLLVVERVAHRLPVRAGRGQVHL